VYLNTACPAPSSGAKASNDASHSMNQAVQSSGTFPSGLLIINADDWGRDNENTERILECILQRTVSSVSAMVFMEDSERAAEIAREHSIDAGLHLNLTTGFSSSNTPSRLLECQREVAAYLTRHRLNQVVFHPGLVRSFEYVVAAQQAEYRRLYGKSAGRVDGHHHMHLCENVLLQGLLPRGIVVRRSFSFQRGEKGLVNRLYRQTIDRRLARRHHLVDFLFSLQPLKSLGRLERIRCLSRRFVVEVETHPINMDEFRFLTEGEVVRWTADSPIAPRFAIAGEECAERIDADRS
jgi:chitin disaccharide deacetylase